MVSVGFHAVLFMIGYFVMAQVVTTPPPVEYIAALPEPVEDFDPPVEPEVENPSPIKSEDTPIPSPEISEIDEKAATDDSEEGEPEGDPTDQGTVDFDSDSRFATIGTSGGASGKWGLKGIGSNKFTGRPGGDGPGKKREPTPEVMRGLDWLARHQSADGSWSCDNFSHRCSKNVCDGAGSHAEYTPGTTSLAVLAY
ncbi:MAG: hypothetical protein ACYTGX_16920, partial [Planctomycetota bacterium]